MGKSSLIKSTFLITFCSILGIAISFVSQLIIAYFFGAGFERDAYFVANTIPVYLSAIITGSAGMVFLPRVVKIKDSNPSELSNFLSTLFGTLIIFCLLIGVGCAVFSEKIVGLMATGFNAEQVAFTSRILIIIIPTFVFSTLVSLLSSLYQIQNRFLYAALAPIISSAVSLLFVIFLSEKMGIFGLAWGFLTGSVVSFLYLLPILKVYKVRFLINLKNIELMSFVKTFLPLLITGILFRSTNIFERSIASNLQEGSISFLGYSSQILAILASLTSNGIGVSIYPTFSKLWVEKNMLEFNHFFIKIVRVLLLISVPIALVTILWGDSFIKVIFERGAFNHHTTVSVGVALAWSMGAFVFQNLGNVVSKIFYISGKTTVLSVIATIELVLYISLAYFLSARLSFIGLAVALSVSSMVNILLSLCYIYRKLIRIEFGILFRDLLKIIIISVISFSAVYLVYDCLIKVENFWLLLVNLAGGLLFFVLLGISIRMDEFLYLKDRCITLIRHSNGRRNNFQ